MNRLRTFKNKSVRVDVSMPCGDGAACNDYTVSIIG